MRNAMKHILLIGMVILATVAKAVTYSPYRGKGIYLNTERLEHEQFSTATPMSSSGVAIVMTSTGSTRTMQNSNVGVATISLPALSIHNKNVAALTLAAAETEESGSGPRRVSPINPDEENDVEFPIGDGLWVMIFLAFAYGVARVKSERMNE